MVVGNDNVRPAGNKFFYFIPVGNTAVRRYKQIDFPRFFLLFHKRQIKSVTVFPLRNNLVRIHAELFKRRI